jgi:hypothetical protein
LFDGSIGPAPSPGDAVTLSRCHKNYPVIASNEAGLPCCQADRVNGRIIMAGKVMFVETLPARSRDLIAITLGLGLAFQVGHFTEHAVQFAVWATGNYPWVVANFCGRKTAYMSPPVTELVRLAGLYLFSTATAARQMMLGMELLHLIGNIIFLSTIVGIFCLYLLRLVRLALYIEAAHLCEHLALTASAYFVGKPIGLSTMFGHAGPWWGSEAAVGYRVTFHFVMNLLPMPFVMTALMQQWRASQEAIARSYALGAMNVQMS